MGILDNLEAYLENTLDQEADPELEDLTVD
jgi:hypothetical protein